MVLIVGDQERVACEMTKWFNTNYHYIVPEYEKDVQLKLLQNKPLEAFREAKSQLGVKGKPVIIGPLSFAKFSKGQYGSIPDYVHQLIPLYVQILQELSNEGCDWVQMDEPFLVTNITQEDLDLVGLVYKKLNLAVPKIQIMLQTYFDSVEHFSTILNLPVDGIGLDFVHGFDRNIAALEANSFPKNKILGVGLINGRNIWRSNLVEKYNFLQRIFKHVPADRVWIQPSCSLLLTPVSCTVKNEKKTTK